MYTILIRFYLITILLQECAQRLTDAEALARRAHEEYSDWLGTPFAAYILYSSMCVSRAPGTYIWLQIGHTYGHRLHIGAYVVAGALSPTTLAALSFRCVAAEAQAHGSSVPLTFVLIHTCCLLPYSLLACLLT